MKFCILLTIFIINSQAFKLSHKHWNIFKLIHSKSYLNSKEEIYRLNIFLKNVELISKHNELYRKGLKTYKLGVNKFTDLSHEEFSQLMNGFKKSNKSMLRSANVLTGISYNLPEEIDWRQKGAVTAVKNQGNCASCWSFSATGALEAQHFLKTGKLVSLSEQNLVDCSYSYGNEGCDGGNMDYAFAYISDNKGIDSEDFYPYEGLISTKCKYDSKFKAATDVGSYSINVGDEEELKMALATVGPVSVGLDASHYTFQMYTGGIYHEPNCSSKNLNHGVLVVGYGTSDDGQDYYLIKNSWGLDWGENGYMKLARNRDNHCGVATQASFPIV